MNINDNIIPTSNVIATYLDKCDFNSIFFGINTPPSLILTDLVIIFHLHFLKLLKASSFSVFSEVRNSYSYWKFSLSHSATKQALVSPLHKFFSCLSQKSFA